MNSELIEHQLHKMLGPINFNTLHAPWHALIILILFAHNTSIDNIKDIMQALDYLFGPSTIHSVSSTNNDGQTTSRQVCM